MASKTGEMLTLLFLGLALGFWLIAMTTHGWLIKARTYGVSMYSDLFMIYMDALK